MSLLELKSDLAKFRKIKPTIALEDKKSSYNSPIKRTSDITLNIPNNKIPKFENSANTIVLQGQKINYSKFKIGNRTYQSLSKKYLISDTVNEINLALLPKISKLFGQSVKSKISNFTKQIINILPKSSLYKLVVPNTLPKISNFVKILPKSISFITPYVKILPLLINKLSIYIKILPLLISKLSLYIKISPKDISKDSLYKLVIPRMKPKISYFIRPLMKEIPKTSDFVPYKIGSMIRTKLTLFETILLDNSSRFDTIPKIIKNLRADKRIYMLYTLPPGVKYVTNWFKDIDSGAYGFTANMKVTQYLGINNEIYIYPKSVKNGRLVDLNSYVRFYQNYSLVTFKNNLVNAKYKRIYNTWDNPYVNNQGKLTNEEYGLYKWSRTRKSPSPLELIYTSYNLRDDSFNNVFSYIRQPFILSGIQRKNNPSPESYNFGVPGIDLVRAGIVGSTKRAVIDVVRIGKFLISPRGLGFILKQFGMQASNPKGYNAIYGKTTRTYDPLSIVSNIATQHLGIRIRRDGIPATPATKFSDITVQGSLCNGTNDYLKFNRLIKLKGVIFSSNPVQVRSPIRLLTGNGGPNSLYGIGTTAIRRYIDSTDNIWYSANGTRYTGLNTLNKYSINGKKYSVNTIIDSSLEWTGNDSLTIKWNQLPNTKESKLSQLKDYNQYYTYDYRQLQSISKRLNSSYTTKINNFLLGVDNSKFKYIPNQIDYTFKNLHKTYGIPSYPMGRDLRDINKSQSVDRIGKLRVLNSSQSEEFINSDFIKFKFSNFSKSENLHFRAYLISFSENYNAEFRHINIIGRSDPAYIHTMHERTANIVFKVACLSKEELKPTWERINKLANFTMPEYNMNVDYRMKGPLSRFTVGDIYDDTPGFISSLSIDLDDDTIWEIGRKNENTNNAQLPIYITVSLAITILNSQRPTNSSWNFGKDAKI